MQPKSVSQIQITAERFKEICLNDENEENSTILNDLLKDLFNPELGLNTTLNNVSQIIEYLCAGLSFDDFKAKIKHYDNSTVCGLVWNTHYVAYRCRTCGISPCMSLCAECFKNGNHEGHDFNMFRSGAGGACDCGDEHVMSKNGFCKFHGPDRQPAPEAPADLTKCSEIILSNLLYRLLQYFRSTYKADPQDVTLKELITDAQPYLEFLNEICTLGTTMRHILVKYMLNDEFYTKKINEEKTGPSSTLHQIFTNKSNEQDNNLRIPDEFKDVILKPKYTNALNEFLFWCMKYEFPENLVKFLLSLLPEQEYKIEFTRSFVTHYIYISTQILSSDSEQLSSRIVHISVQLFSNELITKIALEECTLLPIFMSTLYNILRVPNLLKLSQIQDNKQTVTTTLAKHYVVDADHQILQENLYWPAISDLANLLTHKIVAVKFLQDSKILNLWLYLISCFQAMNLNERQIYTHVQYDQPAYFSSFSAELEFCSSIAWSFIQHLNNESTLGLTTTFLKTIEEVLFKWLASIGIKSLTSVIRPNPNHLTFHLPLNRLYSLFLYNSLFKQNAKLDSILCFNDFNLADLLAYPLQAQIGYYEVHSNMWVRNGLQMKGQAMTYVQNHFSSSFSDPDLFLLQIILCKFQNHEMLMKLLLDRFYINEYFKIKPTKNSNADTSNASSFQTILKIENKYDLLPLDLNQQHAMLNGFLALLAQLICLKPNLELQNYNLTRTEIVNGLCVNDKTYSQVEESLPDICSLSQAKKDVEKIIKEVADFKQPSFEIHTKGLRQGYYVPKDFVWLEEYNPLHVLLRSVKQREYQESFDRYCEFIKTKNLHKDLINKLWPPLRLPKFQEGSLDQELLLLKLQILDTKNLHGLLFTLLFNHFKDSPLPEKSLYFVIYILELALYKKQLKKEMNKQSLDEEESMDTADVDNFKDQSYEDWFRSNNILENLCKVIPFIEYEEPATPTKDLNDESPTSKTSFKSKFLQLPPLKRVCSGLPFFIPSLDKSPPTTSSNLNDQTEAAKVPTIKKTIPIGESMLSLLVKIMHKYQNMIQGMRMSESENESSSFGSTPTTSTSPQPHQNPFQSLISTSSSIQVPIFEFKNEINESRVGDEYYFISNLLNKAALLSPKCKKTIEEALDQINAKRVSTVADDEEEAKRKKAKAKARQTKLMAKMASNQQAFLSKAAKDEDIIEDNLGDTKLSTDEDMNITQKSYDCCICRVSSVPTAERPIGVVTLLQSSNVLAYRDTSNAEKKLPLNSNEKVDISTTCWRLEEERYKLLLDTFDNKTCRYGFNIGWKAGVYTQTCGHYLHFDCYSSYKETLSVQPQNFNSFISGEYWCPLCRQIANCLLPIMSFASPKALPKTENNEDTLEYAEKILNMLKTREILDPEMLPKTPTTPSDQLPTSRLDNQISTYTEPSNITTAIQSIQAFTPQFNTPDDVQYLTSVLRTQLEISILMKENIDLAVNPNVKRCCFVPLFDVISTHCRELCNDKKIHLKLWRMLTNPIEVAEAVATTSESGDGIFPVLLHDPVCLMLVILVNLPSRVHIAVYKKFVSLVFNLVYVQNIVAVMTRLSNEQKEKFLNNCKNEKFKQYCELIVLKLKKFNLCEFIKPTDKSNSINDFKLNDNNLQEYIEHLCLPFLKTAALLQSYLYEQDLNIINKFENLVQHIQLDYLDLSTNSYLENIIGEWIRELSEVVKSQPTNTVTLLQMKEIVYKQPNLLTLPNIYADLFSFYSQKKCIFCTKIPKEPAICLVCGEHLCYKTSSCCDEMRTFSKEHTNNCGAGTILLLNINSTYIYVVRGRRCAGWASLYLDEHGEEDRDLKRGKPLYLSTERYHLLKCLWLGHAFDQQNNFRWYNTSLFI